MVYFDDVLGSQTLGPLMAYMYVEEMGDGRDGGEYEVLLGQWEMRWIRWMDT